MQQLPTTNDDVVLPLSHWGRYIGMTELSGPLVKKPIPRTRKIRFICHGCGQQAEDYAVGFIVSSEINSKTGKRMFLVRGNFAASCVYRWIQEQRNTFAEQVLELFTVMFMEVYGVSREALSAMKKNLPPAKSELLRYQDVKNQDVKDTKQQQQQMTGVQFHEKYKLGGMQAPNTDKDQVFEARSTFVLEASSLRTLSKPLSWMTKHFPSLYFQANTQKHELLPNSNLKGISLFSVLESQKQQTQQKQAHHETDKNKLDQFLKPLPKNPG